MPFPRRYPQFPTPHRVAGSSSAASLSSLASPHGTKKPGRAPPPPRALSSPPHVSASPIHRGRGRRHSTVPLPLAALAADEADRPSSQPASPAPSSPGGAGEAAPGANERAGVPRGAAIVVLCGKERGRQLVPRLSRPVRREVSVVTHAGRFARVI